MNKLILLFIPIALVVIVPTPCLGNVNYSNICLNSSNYNGSATIGSYTCDFYLAYQSDIDWNDPASTTSEINVLQWGKYCCSDGKSVLHDDYSKICKNPSTYIGTNIVTSMGTNNCDEIMFLTMISETQYMFRNMPFSTLKCSDLKEQHAILTLEKRVAPTCCSDKKSICDRDYSKLCKDPSTYNKDGKFSKDVTGDEDNVCGGYNVAKIMAMMKKKDLNISNVDSNTCADYDFLNGDGTTMNLLTHMEAMSTCCGANGGGVAKNGCKAALDTTAFGSKSISIGAISFILPMIVMAYFHCAI